MKKAYGALLITVSLLFAGVAQAATIGQQSDNSNEVTFVSNGSSINGFQSNVFVLPPLLGTLRSFDVYLSMSSHNLFNSLPQPLPSYLTIALGGPGCPSSAGTDAPGNFYFVTDLGIPVTNASVLPTSSLAHFALHGPNNVPVYAGQGGCTIQFFQSGGSGATLLDTKVATGTTDQIYFVGYNTYGPVPHITRASMHSSNASSTLAKAGDAVEVDFDVDEAVQTPQVTIMGRPASVATTTGNSFQATTTLADTDADGPVVFNVVVTSTLGDDSSPQSTTTDGTLVSADVTAPSLTADSRITNDQLPLIGGAVSDAQSGVSSVSATVNGTAYPAQLDASGSWSVTLPNLPDGTYGIAAVASDFAGNQSQATGTLTIDRTPPVVSITGGPADGSLTNVASAGFSFTSDTQPIVCALDGGTYADCSSGSVSYAGLSAGTHLFSVSASDAAGNTTTVSHNWSVDTAAPILKEVAFSTSTNDTTPSYVFSSSKAGIIAYGGACTSTSTQAVVGDNTITFNQLAVGTYSNCTLRVTDAAGNLSNLLTVSTFTINPVVVTRHPHDKDECKGNHWRDFSDPKFKNQGDCVSYTVSNKYHDKDGDDSHDRDSDDDHGGHDHH